MVQVEGTQGGLNDTKVHSNCVGKVLPHPRGMANYLLDVFGQFLASWIAAKTNRTTATNHIKKDSHHPLVSIAPPTNSRASAASRSAGASGHCGGLGAVIAILSHPRVNLWRDATTPRGPEL
jgi:hypothetical protein